MTLRNHAIIASLLCSLCAAEAQAGPSRQERHEAHQLYVRAKQLARQGDSDEAAEAYLAADELNPAPSYKLGAGRALVELGRLLEAVEIFEECAATKPRQWAEKQARVRCEALAEQTSDSIPTLEIEGVAPAEADVEITLDGEAIDPDEGELRLDPGEHEVEARAVGYRSFSEIVELREGEGASVAIVLEPAPRQPQREPEDESGGISPVPAYLFWGMGAVGLGLGVGFGIAAVDATNVVRDDYACDGNVCPPRAADDIRVAQTDGVISTVGFVAGGTAVAVGTVLYLLSGDDSHDEEEGDGRDEEETAHLRIQPLVAPTYFGLRAQF